MEKTLRITDPKKYGVPRTYIMKHRERHVHLISTYSTRRQCILYYIKLDRQILWCIFLLIILMMMDIVETFNTVLTFNKPLVLQTSSRCNKAFILSSSFNVTDDLECKNVQNSIN